MPTIAVIGASKTRSKFGNKALRAYRSQGYTVVPVNPNATEVEGEKSYASVEEYPGTIDEATVYVPPAIGLPVIDQIARKGIGTVWLNPGADGPAVVARARELGLTTNVACSIMGVGESPANF
jgi:predicted CoA-binding protein